MIVAAALLLGALLTGMLAPTPLSRLSGRGNPSVQLSWWLAICAAAATSTMIGAVLLLLGDRPHVEGGPWQPCWAILGHSSVHPFDELVGILLLTVMFLIIARIIKLVRRRIAAQRRTHTAHLTAAAARSLSHVDGVLWIEHTEPFAYSISGKPGLVVASTALNDLPATHREAVLHHERHHLRHRHHWLVIAADALGQAMPRVPLFRAAARAARTLTEHSADEGAAIRVGTEAVTGVLLTLGERERSTVLRRFGRSSRPARLAGHLTAIAASSVLPIILGGVLFGAAIMLAC